MHRLQDMPGGVQRNLQAAGEQPVPQGAQLTRAAPGNLNEAGSYVPNGVFGYFVSMACNHCVDPACVANWVRRAPCRDEETGIVWTDHEVYIGCKTCQTVCPYDAPTYDDEAGYMLKCDMCKAELEAGGSKPPSASPAALCALDFGTREDMIAKYGEGDVEVEPCRRTRLIRTSS